MCGLRVGLVALPHVHAFMPPTLRTLAYPALCFDYCPLDFHSSMLAQVYGTCVAWAVHWVVAWLVLRAMSVPGVPWSELLAYTGYPFVFVCFAVVAQQIGGAQPAAEAHVLGVAESVALPLHRMTAIAGCNG